MFQHLTGGFPNPWGSKGDPGIDGGGRNMDPVLIERCLEVLEGDVDSEKFASLLLQSGIEPQGVEWDFASRLLERGDQMRSTVRKFGNTLQ